MPDSQATGKPIKKSPWFIRGPKALGRSLLKDCFASLLSSLKRIKAMTTDTAEVIQVAAQQSSQKKNLDDLEQQLHQLLSNKLALRQKVKRTTRFCWLLLAMQSYVGWVWLYGHHFDVNLWCGALSVLLSLRYLQFRLWLFMVEKQQRVTVGKWLRTIYRRPLSFFPVGISVFTD